jgi:hypothetical protein
MYAWPFPECAGRSIEFATQNIAALPLEVQGSMVDLKVPFTAKSVQVDGKLVVDDFVVEELVRTVVELCFVVVLEVVDLVDSRRGEVLVAVETLLVGLVLDARLVDETALVVELGLLVETGLAGEVDRLDEVELGLLVEVRLVVEIERLDEVVLLELGLVDVETFKVLVLLVEVSLEVVEDLRDVELLLVEDGKPALVELRKVEVLLVVNGVAVTPRR